MGEVSGRITRSLLDAVELEGEPIGPLLRGVSTPVAYLRNSTRYVPWVAYVELMERLARRFGESWIREVGVSHYTLPNFRFYNRVAGMLLSPRQIYHAGANWYGHRLFTQGCVRVTNVDLSDGRIEQTLEIREDLPDCPAFFTLMLGAIESGPSLLALPNAIVEFTRSERRAQYRISLPARMPLLQRARAMMRIAVGARAAIDELGAQAVDLSWRNAELQEAQRKIENQSQALEQVNAQLEQKVRERTAELQTANSRLRASLAQHERDARALQESQQQLRASERLASVGTLAAGIAHEINNPVASMLASAEYALAVRDEPEAADVACEVLERVVAEAERCGRIVRSVLQFARRDETEKWLEDMGRIAHRAFEGCRDYAASRGVALELESFAGELHVSMNPIEIEQVLANLMRNAIEAGSTKVRLSLSPASTSRGAEGQPCVRIRVSDDGRGISREDLPRIFDPFFTTRLAEGGTGLGLSIAFGIVQGHGGEFVIESSSENGTVMGFDLPLPSSGDGDRTP